MTETISVMFVNVIFLHMYKKNERNAFKGIHQSAFCFLVKLLLFSLTFVCRLLDTVSRFNILFFFFCQAALLGLLGQMATYITVICET